MEHLMDHSVSYLLSFQHILLNYPFSQNKLSFSIRSIDSFDVLSSALTFDVQMERKTTDLESISSIEQFEWCKAEIFDVDR